MNQRQVAKCFGTSTPGRFYRNRKGNVSDKTVEFQSERRVKNASV